MKKFLAVVLILIVMCATGCGDKKTADNPVPAEQSSPAETKVEQPVPKPEKVNAVAVAGTLWAINEENMLYLADAIARDDSEYLQQLALEKKVFNVDRDTKVTRIGTATDEDNVIISFKEGRYTNKTGYTFAYNIFTEEEYPAYLEAKAANEQDRRQKIIDVVYRYLINTDDYFEFIKAGNIEEVKRIEEWIKAEEKKIIDLKNNVSIDSDIRECAEKAQKVVICRYVVIYTYLKYGIINEKDYGQAEQLRQEFRDKYGY